MKAGCPFLVATALTVALPALAGAQWIDFPTPGIPRLADGKPNLAGPAPRTHDGKPDLSGIWRAGRAGEYGYDYDVTRELKPGEVQPWAEAVRLKRVQDFRKDSPLANCMPVSVPFLNFRGLSRIVQTPGLIVVLYESPNSPHRTIFTDGRSLPKEMNPTWLGYSVGRWEGDTLVVTTAGFNDRGWLDVGGHPQPLGRQRAAGDPARLEEDVAVRLVDAERPGGTAQAGDLGRLPAGRGTDELAHEDRRSAVGGQTGRVVLLDRVHAGPVHQLHDLRDRGRPHDRRDRLPRARQCGEHRPERDRVTGGGGADALLRTVIGVARSREDAVEDELVRARGERP